MCANLIEHIDNTHNRFALTKARRTRAPKRVLFPTLLIYGRTSIIDAHSLGLKRGAWGSFSLYYCHFRPKLCKKLRNTAILTKNEWLKTGKIHTHHEKAG